MIRAQVVEVPETTMARFLHGLHRNIADVVEMQVYYDVNEMVHQAMKVEKKLKREECIC